MSGLILMRNLPAGPGVPKDGSLRTKRQAAAKCGGQTGQLPRLVSFEASRRGLWCGAERRGSKPRAMATMEGNYVGNYGREEHRWRGL